MAITIRELMQMANEFFVWLQGGLGAQQENTTSPAPETAPTGDPTREKPFYEAVYGKAKLTKAALLALASSITMPGHLLNTAKEYLGMDRAAVIAELGPLENIKDFPTAWQQVVEIKT